MAEQWHPPKGVPPIEQLVEVNEKLRELLAKRGHEVSADPALAMYRVVAVERILLELGLVTEEQLAYYEAHAEFMELKRFEEDTRMKPRIVIPGSDA